MLRCQNEARGRNRFPVLHSVCNKAFLNYWIESETLLVKKKSKNQTQLKLTVRFHKSKLSSQFHLSQLFLPLMLLRSEHCDPWACPWAQEAAALVDAIRIPQQSGMLSRGNPLWLLLEMDCLEQSK